jgi:integrase
MARKVRAQRLETRTSRLKLPINKRPEWTRIGQGVSIGYRRNQGPGTWVVRVSNGRGGHWTKAIGIADDHADADGGQVLDFWQAQERARAVGLGARNVDNVGKLATLREAVDVYKIVLEERGGDSGNVGRIRVHLPDTLAGKTVALLTVRDFGPWKDALKTAKLTPAAINRSNTALKAALNLAAEQDERIANARVWARALKGVPDAEVARNVVLPESDIRVLIGTAAQVSSEFELLLEVAAVTGARVSQIRRLEVRDVQDGPPPRLMMPSARKGKGTKRIDRRPVPIPAGLAARLQKAAADRPGEAPLLIKPSGDRWKRADHIRLFSRVVSKAREADRLKTSKDVRISIYALRHSSITRDLLAGVPIRMVAASHDTSTQMIERNYSESITDHGDALSRRALLDLAEPSGANVVMLAKQR